MNSKVLKLKEDVSISKFDDGNLDDMYVIRYENRYWKVSSLINDILQGMNGRRTVPELCSYLLEEKNIEVNEEKLNQVIDVVCINNGLLEGTQSISKKKTNKMLWGRITIIPEKIVEKLKVFQFLFDSKVIGFFSVLVLSWLGYIFLTNSNDNIVNQMLGLKLTDIVLCYVFIMLAGIIHEFGHSTATLRYGGKAGKIGVGVYLIMPVLYSDVTDAWRLKRRERIVVDLGGMYLQGIFLLICYLINTFFIRHSLLHMAILLSGFQILGNLNPFIKLDGYWILVDYLGEVEIFTVVKKVWADVWLKFRKKEIKSSEIGKQKRTVVYGYSVFTFFFYIYFIRFFANTAIAAINVFTTDIIFLIQKGVSAVPLTPESIYVYLSNRITSILVLIFIVRMLLMAITKLLQIFRKRNISPDKNAGRDNE